MPVIMRANPRYHQGLYSGVEKMTALLEGFFVFVFCWQSTNIHIRAVLRSKS